MKTWGIKELTPHYKDWDLFTEHDSSHLCASNKTIIHRRQTQGKKGSYLQRVCHSFCNFWYSKHNHSGNTNTIILKWVQGKKKVAEASSNLSKFSDSSSHIWFLLHIQLLANYLHLLYLERELWSSRYSTSCSYSVSQRKVPQSAVSCRVCYSQVSLAGISPCPQKTAHKLSTVGKMKITTPATHRKLSNAKSNRSTELNTELLCILSPR